MHGRCCTRVLLSPDDAEVLTVQGCPVRLLPMSPSLFTGMIVCARARGPEHQQRVPPEPPLYCVLTIPAWACPTNLKLGCDCFSLKTGAMRRQASAPARGPEGYCERTKAAAAPGPRASKTK